MPGEDVFLPVQRQVITKLADEDMAEQPRSRQRPLEGPRRDGRADHAVSPNRTLLRNLSLPAKESERRTLQLMRFRD